MTYILTRIDGSWGIQARFGTDSFREGETVDASAPLGIVGEHLDRLAAGDFEAAGSSVSHPLVDVGIGRVNRYGGHAEVVEGTGHGRRETAFGAGRPRGAGRVGRRGSWRRPGRTPTEARVQAVFVVGRPEGVWRIGGRSIIAP